jgi:hypothetical protein
LANRYWPRGHPDEAAADATAAEKKLTKKERLEWMLRDQAAMGNV